MSRKLQPGPEGRFLPPAPQYSDAEKRTCAARDFWPARRKGYAQPTGCSIARRAVYPTRSSGTKPADRAAAVKARRATPTGTRQSMAASTCFRAVNRASSAIGHLFSNQYFTCSIVLNFCTSPSGDMTKERGFPQVISINRSSFLNGKREMRIASPTLPGKRVQRRTDPAFDLA